MPLIQIFDDDGLVIEDEIIDPAEEARAAHRATLAAMTAGAPAVRADLADVKTDLAAKGTTLTNAAATYTSAITALPTGAQAITRTEFKTWATNTLGPALLALVNAAVANGTSTVEMADITDTIVHALAINFANELGVELAEGARPGG